MRHHCISLTYFCLFVTFALSLQWKWKTIFFFRNIIVFTYLKQNIMRKILLTLFMTVFSVYIFAFDFNIESVKAKAKKGNVDALIYMSVCHLYGLYGVENSRCLSLCRRSNWQR